MARCGSAGFGGGGGSGLSSTTAVGSRANGRSNAPHGARNAQRWRCRTPQHVDVSIPPLRTPFLRVADVTPLHASGGPPLPPIGIRAYRRTLIVPRTRRARPAACRAHVVDNRSRAPLPLAIAVQVLNAPELACASSSWVSGRVCSTSNSEAGTPSASNREAGPQTGGGMRGNMSARARGYAVRGECAR
eukprot:scaffold3992_cov137-Isochrysis_galbana.AAC.4